MRGAFGGLSRSSLRQIQNLRGRRIVKAQVHVRVHDSAVLKFVDTSRQSTAHYLRVGLTATLSSYSIVGLGWALKCATLSSVPCYRHDR